MPWRLPPRNPRNESVADTPRIVHRLPGDVPILGTSVRHTAELTAFAERRVSVNVLAHEVSREPGDLTFVGTSASSGLHTSRTHAVEKGARLWHLDCTNRTARGVMAEERQPQSPLEQGQRDTRARETHVRNCWALLRTPSAKTSRRCARDGRVPQSPSR